MKETVRKNKGITLIALVITIVIILILAAVSINLVLGENGIINRAKEANQKAGESDAVINIDLAYAECYIDTEGDESQITAESFQTKLRTMEGYEDAVVTLEENVFTITIGTDVYLKPLSGQTVKQGPGPTISNIKVVANSNGTGDNIAAHSSNASKLYIVFNAETSEDGATISKVQIKNNESFTDITIPYKVTKNGVYTFKVISSTGTSTIKDITVDQFGLKQGDFIDYDAGTWGTTAEIEEQLGSLYLGTSNPDSTTPYKFGGFGPGDSRNVSRNPQYGTNDNNHLRGWIVVKVNNNGTVLIVSAGTVETYYHPYEENNGYKSQYVLTGSTSYTGEDNIIFGLNYRNWNEYINTSKGATEAHCITYDEMKSTTTYGITQKIGAYYYLATLNNVNNLRCVFSDGNYAGKNGTNYGCFGIRVAVTLQSGLQITGGLGKPESPYTYTYNNN